MEIKDFDNGINNIPKRNLNKKTIKNNHSLYKSSKDNIKNDEFEFQNNKKRITKKEIKNPGITHFNIDSNFIYDLGNPKDFILSIENKNIVKLNNNELYFLKAKINEMKKNFLDSKNDDYINISIDELNLFNNNLGLEETENEDVKWVKKKFRDNENNKDKLSCKKLVKLYLKEKGKKISKTKIYYIIKNKTNLSYLKTSVKNYKAKNNNSIFMKLCFIKIITRAINLGFNILFMDESSILSKNNNYRRWRMYNEVIYSKMEPAKRSNLLLTVDKNDVIFYKLNKESTNEDSFYIYINELIDIIEKQNKEKYIIVLDNLSAHKTSKIINFFIEKKINIIYNVPYISEFNSVELCFRYIKRHLYENLFYSLNETENYVTEVLEDNRIKRTLLKNYCETLNVYLNNSYQYQNLNLNSLNYEV